MDFVSFKLRRTIMQTVYVEQVWILTGKYVDSKVEARMNFYKMLDYIIVRSDFCLTSMEGSSKPKSRMWNSYRIRKTSEKSICMLKICEYKSVETEDQSRSGKIAVKCSFQRTSLH